MAEQIGGKGMTKFEKVAKKAELLEYAYNAILDRDRWDNMVDGWADNPELNMERADEHRFYLEVAALVEGLLAVK